SNEVSVTPLPLVPAGPTSLTQSADDTTASLGWTAPTSDNTHGEPSTSGYKIYNGNAASPLSNITLPAITITGTSALVTGLINGTPYIFRVTASNTGGEGSAATFAAVTLHPLAPATPVLSAPISGDGLVSLSWAQSSGATGYSVYRDGIALKASPITALTYIDSSAINGTTYRYTVKAFNLGVTSEFSNEVSATPLPPVPSAPTNLQATAGIPGSDSISLSWVASQRATSYKVYRGDVAGFIIGIPFATPSTNSYTDSVATSRSGAYYYKVAATNMGGDSVLLSNEVSAVSSPVSHPTVITSNPSNTSGILAGVSTSFQWRIADLDLEPLSYSINWGDGSARQNSTITVDSITGTYNPLNLTHKWSSAGGYNIVLTIGGAHGDSATSNVSVQVSGIVNPPPPPATISKIVNLINQKMTAAINNLLSK
ncbi:MAG: fibronectin type III domain-containing protein, partial [Candidatus Vogelbacteria bacterium]|nr:fibronectin type III domain-containing protein [Candidatus Vogelbacteria bacterium]